VTFTPIDIADYTTAQATVSLTVTDAEATELTWKAPADITYGTALSADQLNATAPVPGTFVYAPSVGDMLAAGTHTLSVIFTPADTNLPMAEAAVALTVAKATPAIAWPKPNPIAYGVALGANQLNATAPIAGTFAYTPAAGDVLPAGTQNLSVIFTPSAASDYSNAEAAVLLSVTKATPTITWRTPADIPYGSPLGADQLNATATVPGTFSYTPGPGNVLTAGMQTLSVAFTPTDASNYTAAQATVRLVVQGLPNLADGQEAGDADAEDLEQSPEAENKSMREQEGRAESKAAAESAASQAAKRTPDNADTKRGPAQNEKTTNQQGKLETRTYKGATYVKGADGQWHLEQK
jgi:hypothetical protein